MCDVPFANWFILVCFLNVSKKSLMEMSEKVKVYNAMNIVKFSKDRRIIKALMHLNEVPHRFAS